MEKEKNNKGLLVVLIIIIILLLCALGYLLFGKELLNKSSENNAIPTTNNIKSTDELYNEYLLNLKDQITKQYKEYSNNVVTGNTVLDTDYTFTIKNNLDLIFNSKNKKYSDYKISENVLNMFLIEVGNGGNTYLYFIKTDGTLNKMCIDCLTENSTIKFEKEDKKYIVNIIQGLFDYDYSGAWGPIFIDINGNIYKN